MRILMLYRPDSDHARSVEEFIHEVQRRHGIKLEVYNIDTRDGAALATLYDIVRYPAVLALQDDGTFQNSWVGEDLPLIDEVLSYAEV